MSDVESYALPAKLDLSAAGALARDLLARRGTALTLDASGVTHIGTPGLQVLLSACKTWEADAAQLTLTNFSASLAEQLAPMGLSEAALTPSSIGGTAAESAPLDGPDSAGMDTAQMPDGDPEQQSDGADTLAPPTDPAAASEDPEGQTKPLDKE
ncbi:MAG: STAS domain-containing protein [Pseudomonadota bacterium]